MAECDMCGREAHTRLHRIESAEVMACASCGRYGILISQEKKIKQKNIPQNNFSNKSRGSNTRHSSRRDQNYKIKSSMNKILIEDYGTTISRSREKLGISRKELAESMFIRETLLMRIETEKVRPNDEIIKKLEKTLEISLMESSDQEMVTVSDYRSQTSSSRSRALTLGDFAKIKKSKSN